MKPSPLHSVLLVAVLSLCVGGPVLAQQKLIHSQSEIGFTSKQMGVPVDGKFTKFDAQVSFDPAKSENANVTFRVNTGSATLGAAEADAELPKASWFNIIKYPQATFQSTGVKSLGAAKYLVSGKLSVKGNVRDVEFPVVLSQAGGTTTVAGQFVLKRLNFKVGENEWADTSMVADDVQVKFKLALDGVRKL